TAVRFWIHGGSKGGQSIAFKVIDAYNKNWESLVSITPSAGQWSEVTVPLERLNSPEEIGALVWQDNAGNEQPTFSLDGITLVARTGPPPTPLPPVAGPALTIDAQAGRKPISPYIYGMNFASEELAADLVLPVRRWGGNATTMYNFKLDVHNTGSDWYFENIPEYNSNVAALPDGSSVDRTIDQDIQTGTKTIISLPVIGWTPKRRVENHPYDCSYKVSKYGAQESTDAWDPDCGNGKDKNGNNLTGNDPNDAYMPVTPEFIQEWITHLTTKYGKAADGGVMFYNLGNEPMLWPYTHRDVHPEMTTYDEVRDRTFLYAPVLKQIDPTAQTLGPVSWGWCGYLYSAKDECKAGPDYAAHNNTYFVEWYLQQMAAYEKEHGVRLLDYLDLHIYPQAQGIASDSPGDPNAQELRLRSTRSLWDPTYTDESWIDKPIFLIPQMREWVDKNYPGTKLALTEYSWGGKGSLNGALAQADILGIFGREGLDLATLWNPPDVKQPASHAFRMYLNYDGKGSTFGETSVSAVSADQEKLAVYAAQRKSDGALTLIIIN
ncbi:MAG: glycoside hydrolase family 44 protein, partial [Anaerolineaceae bacterium]|nr:glycoside hydrolase family 44 protein [Anaerolineaceae bacterium]